MRNDTIDEQISEMEMEFEMETDDEFEFDMENSDEESDEEYEQTGYESDDGEFEFEFEDYEEEPQGEYEWFDGNNADYGERFYELSQREYESETEVDEAVERLLTEMENEFFFGNVWKKAKSAAAGLAKKGMDLAKKAGIKLPSLDALKSMLGPVSGLLKGNLGALIKPAIKAALMAHPAGAALLPALKSFGFETGEDGRDNREAYDRYAAVAREAFESLAESINQNADNPLEASRLATNAFQKSLRNHQNRRYNRPTVGSGGGLRTKKRVRRVYAAPGEIIVVIQRKK